MPGMVGQTHHQMQMDQMLMMSQIMAKQQQLVHHPAEQQLFAMAKQEILALALVLARTLVVPVLSQ